MMFGNPSQLIRVLNAGKDDRGNPPRFRLERKARIDTGDDNQDQAETKAKLQRVLSRGEEITAYSTTELCAIFLALTPA
jgi:hypothetical protein